MIIKSARRRSKKNNWEFNLKEENPFFSKGNENNVKDFLIYMRKRDLTEEKKKWKII